jgi:hypothetical protein
VPDPSSPSDPGSGEHSSEDPHRPPEERPGEHPDPQQQRLLPVGAIEFLTLGLTWAVLLVGLGFLGSLVDGWLGTSPAFVLVGLALAIAVGIRMTIVRVRKYL